MIDIQDAKSRINIVEVAERMFQLKKKGANYWACCPLHHEKTPSFSIDPSGQFFKCFGCGEGGDVIDLVRKVNGMDFQGALAYLGIEDGEVNHEARQNMARKKRNSALIERFREWEDLYSHKIGTAIFEAHRLIESDPSFCGLYHGVALWEYHMSIMISGNDKLKQALYQEVEFDRSL